MTQDKMLATVSGSFRQAMSQIQDAVYALTDAGVAVLSPADPRVVDNFGDFLFVASDRLRTIRTVQSRHLAAIANSNFVWLVSPAGYVGVSASMEIGFASAHGVPVYADTPPMDLTIRQYVTIVGSIREAIARENAKMKSDEYTPKATVADVLLDPIGSIELAHQELVVMQGILTTSAGAHAEDAPRLRDAARMIRRAIRSA